MSYITNKSINKLAHLLRTLISHRKTYLNEKKAISNAYLIPPRTLRVNKENDVGIQRPQNMQKAGFIMNQLI